MPKSIFQSRSLSPMLIGRTATLPELAGEIEYADYITELKFDGERLTAYLDPAAGTTHLLNRHLRDFAPKFPELAKLHERVTVPCLLDGEVIVSVNGTPSFPAVASRGRMSNPISIKSASKANPATFVAFDLLYHDRDTLLDMPQQERSNLLRKAIPKDTHSLTVSQYFEGDPAPVYEFATAHGLEGCVLKRKDAIYTPGKRTQSWIKIKVQGDDDFVICGYIVGKGGSAALILGQYRNGTLVNMGHTLLGMNRPDFALIQTQPRVEQPPFKPQKDEAEAIWLRPQLVCTVQYTSRIGGGRMRHPQYKGLRHDKQPQEAIAPQV